MFRQSDEYLGDVGYDSDEGCRGSDTDDSAAAETASDGESDDDFVAAMDKDVETTMKWMTSPEFQCGLSPPRPSADAASASSSLQAKGSGQNVRYYDDVYFSSGSEEEQGENGATATPPPTRRQKSKVPIPSNDELFYDPDMDDDNERWVQDQRRQYYKDMQPPGLKKRPHCQGQKERDVCKDQETEHPDSLALAGGSTDETAQKADGSPDQMQGASGVGMKGSQASKPQPLPRSDAVLNCPCCMALLCLDCQRHDQYSTQYRAMFVFNCVVVKDEVLSYKEPANKKKVRGRKRRRGRGTVATDAAGSTEHPSEVESKYSPVRCQECNTEVAVYDKDEIYHFFNVITSHAP